MTFTLLELHNSINISGASTTVAGEGLSLAPNSAASVNFEGSLFTLLGTGAYSGLDLNSNTSFSMNGTQSKLEYLRIHQNANLNHLNGDLTVTHALDFVSESQQPSSSGRYIAAAVNTTLEADSIFAAFATEFTAPQATIAHKAFQMSGTFIANSGFVKIKPNVAASQYFDFSANTVVFNDLTFDAAGQCIDFDEQLQILQ